MEKVEGSKRWSVPFECPPLGRPSLIKLVLVKKGSSTHTFSLGFKWFTGYLLTGWVDRDVRNVRTATVHGFSRKESRQRGQARNHSTAFGTSKLNQ